MKNRTEKGWRNFGEAVLKYSAALILTSCGGGEDGVRGTGGSEANGSKVVAAKELTVFTWEDYLAPEVIERFEDETGIKINYEIFSDSDELEACLRSEPGVHDVVIVDDVSLSELTELKLLKPLDHTKLPLLGNLNSEFMDKSFDRGNQYSVPYLWGTWVIAYRTDKFENVPRSWSFLWDERVKGRVMMLEESFDPISITLKMLGRSPNSESPEDYKDATAAMIQQIEKLDAVYGGDMEMKERLTKGSIWAAMCYNGDAARVNEDNPDVDFFVPEEGTPLWIDNFAISRDSRRDDAAHQFINFMMRPDNAAGSANYAWFATPNDAAFALLDPELSGDERVFPPEEIRKKCTTLIKPSGQRSELISQTWHATRAAIRSKKDSAKSSQVSDSE